MRVCVCVCVCVCVRVAPPVAPQKQKTNSETAVHVPPDSQGVMPRPEDSTPSSRSVWGHIANRGSGRRKEGRCVCVRVCVCMRVCVRSC